MKRKARSLVDIEFEAKLQMYVTLYFMRLVDSMFLCGKKIVCK
jgi:hypothetical protein